MIEHLFFPDFWVAKSTISHFSLVKSFTFSSSSVGLPHRTASKRGRSVWAAQGMPRFAVSCRNGGFSWENRGKTMENHGKNMETTTYKWRIWENRREVLNELWMGRIIQLLGIHMPDHSWDRLGISPKKLVSSCIEVDFWWIHSSVVGWVYKRSITIVQFSFLRYTLWLCQNSYWKWPFIVDFPIKNGDFQ